MTQPAIDGFTWGLQENTLRFENPKEVQERADDLNRIDIARVSPLRKNGRSA